ncbi:cupredoxin domain-containing protein [Marinococcus halotolerans]|uniref:cupredoxin domain-containing protein n=1 Tax=Marinococcus halotolerans TaxID=301092 RepID=UPI0003B74898|nr:cupredoxin domain-containing protein [Marinococcus halotolerans]
MKFPVSAFFLALMVFLSGCGGDEGNGSESTSENAEAQTMDVTATDFEFDQKEYTVNAGEPVNVSLTSQEGGHGLAIDGFDVDIQGEGEATFTPEEPGEYNIYCNVPCGEGHADMTATLIVQ